MRILQSFTDWKERWQNVIVSDGDCFHETVLILKNKYIILEENENSRYLLITRRF